MLLCGALGTAVITAMYRDWFEIGIAIRIGIGRLGNLKKPIPIANPNADSEGYELLT